MEQIIDERRAYGVSTGGHPRGPIDDTFLARAHRGFVRTLGIGLHHGDRVGPPFILFQERTVVRPVAERRREHPFPGRSDFRLRVDHFRLKVYGSAVRARWPGMPGADIRHTKDKLWLPVFRLRHRQIERTRDSLQ